MSLSKLSDAGVSIWLDDLSRERLTPGGKAKHLSELISASHVVGVTTNPAIFSSAISSSPLYKEDILRFREAGLDTEEIIAELTCSDVKNACEIFRRTYEVSEGVDGRVSIEVDPRFARDTDSTIKQARYLWEKVNMPNLLIKVPATREGLPAIRQLISEGISVNVTIIFSVARYKEVLAAFISGITDRVSSGLPVSGIHSVASFFVSRVDTEIDPQLKELQLESLLGKSAIANARLAYQHFSEVYESLEWKNLATSGASIQRPLWASTGVKDPNYDPAMYVNELVARHTVNTMPEATLEAAANSQNFKGDSITGKYLDSEMIMSELEKNGIEMEKVADKLEEEGIEKFIKPWLNLISVVEKVTR